MNTPFPTTIRAVLTLAMLACGASLVSTTVPGVGFDAGSLLRAARQAGVDLHAEYGHFGAIGGLFGSRLQIPVSSTTCGAPAGDRIDCAGQG
jgi:hypothetical protein